MRRAERAAGFGFALLSAAGLFGLLLPLADSGWGMRVLLNLAHVPLFALWSVLLFRLCLQGLSARQALRLTLLLASAVALGSEALQSVLPSRQWTCATCSAIWQASGSVWRFRDGVGVSSSGRPELPHNSGPPCIHKPTGRRTPTAESNHVWNRWSRRRT
jgi:hypothetical protein